MTAVFSLFLLSLPGCGSAEDPTLIPVEPIPPGRLVREFRVDSDLDGTNDIRVVVEYSGDNKPLAFAYDLGNDGTIDFTRGADALPEPDLRGKVLSSSFHFPLLPQGPFEPSVVELDQDMNGIPDVRITYFYEAQPVPGGSGEPPLDGNPIPR